MRALLATLAIGALSAVAIALPATAQPGDVSVCTSLVDLDWQDLHFDPDDADTTRANWFVGAVATTSAGTGCAGVPQTLTLLDEDGVVLYEGRVVLDGSGDGRYEGLSVRAEDLSSAQVLLHAPGGVGGGGGTVVPGGAGIPVGPSVGGGALARTGIDTSALVATALALLAAGAVLRLRRRRAAT